MNIVVQVIFSSGRRTLHVVHSNTFRLLLLPHISTREGGGGGQQTVIENKKHCVSLFFSNGSDRLDSLILMCVFIFGMQD